MMARFAVADGRFRTPLFWRGAALVIVLVAVVTLLFFKTPLLLLARGGETITAEFNQTYNLKPGSTKVKLGGVQVGLVESVTDRPGGRSTVDLKVDRSALKLLGAEPSARIEPLTVLGGAFSVNLEPGPVGSYDGADIPASRTSTPVELDRVLEALPADTRTSLRGTIGNVEETLADGGSSALQDFAAEAPKTLDPGARVLTAARGTVPESDLPVLVRDLGAIGSVLSERTGNLESILDDVDTTTATLASRRSTLSTSIKDLPTALKRTRTGLRDLHGTLNLIDDTADDVRPGLAKLDDLFDELNPALDELDPLLDDAGPLLDDAVPTTRHLPPILTQADSDLSDLKGPVLDRVRGPILDTLGSTWRGSGPYKNSGGGLQADNKMYEELGYMAANIDRGSAVHDPQGAMLNFQVGMSLDSVRFPTSSDLLGSLADRVKKSGAGQ
jgi:phospholipid/cholesterol/gamma-HCH transport system substrate-binding protein